MLCIGLDKQPKGDIMRKMKNIRTILVLLSIILFLYGCGKYAMGTVRKTNQLEPGMSIGQVKGIMGDPDSTQFKRNKWVWKYSLHQEWKGFVPYYLVFGKSSKQLESWFADENEYYRQQSLWLQAMPQKEESKIEIKIKTDSDDS